jgi:hypothetical protein
MERRGNTTSRILTAQEKKQRYTSLLYKPDLLNSKLIRSSALAELSGLPQEYVRGWPPVILLLSLIGGLSSVFTLYWFVINGNVYHQVAAVTSTALFVTFSILFILARERRSAAIRSRVVAAHDELSLKIVILEEFIEEFDNRTQRYFHVVTSSKTSAYYLINQALTHMIVLRDKAAKALAAHSSGGVRSAYELLAGNIRIADGVTVGSGVVHDLAVAQLTLALDELIDRLAQDIAELEEDIQRHRSLSIQGSSKPDDV